MSTHVTVRHTELTLASQAKTCDGCSGDAIYKTRKCGGCRKVRYCSRECQQRAWREHKPLCIAAENPGFIDIPFSAAINKLYQAESDRLDAASADIGDRNIRIQSLIAYIKSL
jgi:hypothetical protein